MKKLIIILTFLLFEEYTVNAQWQQTNGPFGGSINCIAASSANIFAGSYGGGVFLSTNYGADWVSVDSGLTNLYIQALLINGSDIFAGTCYGLFLSTNNGANWTSINNGLTNANVKTLTLSGTNIFAGTDGGVFLSTNNGADWFAVNSGLTNLNIQTLMVNGTNIFAGTTVGGVFLSVNNGTSWTQIDNGLPYDTINSGYYCISSLAVSDTNIFAGTKVKGMFLSTNNGASWAAVNAGLTCSEVNAITVVGTNIFAGTWGLGGVYLSTNNGTSWTAANYGLTHKGIQALTVSGTNIYAGTCGGGVFLSNNNGTSWNAENNGLKNNDVISMAVNGTSIFAGTWLSSLFLSVNNGTSWTTTPLTNTCTNSLIVIGTDIFAGTSGGGVYLSTDDGISWVPKNTGLTNMAVKTLAVAGTNIFAGTSGGVFLSTNNGNSWNAVSTGLTNTEIYSLTVSGTNIFAGTWGSGVFLSTNNGTSWAAVNAGLTDGFIYSLTVIGTNIFAGTRNNGVFLSTDNGTSWTAVNTGLTDEHVHAFLVSGTKIFAGTDGGVFISTNNGMDWIEVNTGLSHLNVRTLAINGTNLFSGILNSGVWKRPLSDFNFFNFSGNVFNDINNNGIRDSGEAGIHNAIIKTKSNNWVHNTDDNGNYVAYSSSMNDSLTVANLPYATITPLVYNVTYQDTGKNFAVHFIPHVKDLRIAVTNFSFSRPGWDNLVKITYENVGTDTVTGTVSLDFDQKLVFVNCSPVQSNITGYTLTWNFSDLLPFEQRSIDVLFHIPTTVQGHDWLYFTGTIYPIIGDTCPINNIFNMKNECIAPGDPNYKEVIPENGLTPEQISIGDDLFYTIHFQNTGTDTAFNVVIKDTLSPYSDVTTFAILSSSYPCTFSIHEAGIATFYFNNIQLPDSNVNFIGSNGFVKYTVKPRSDLQLGNNIENTANIYFDYNLPVATNTTSTMIVTGITESIIKGDGINIYPNPANDYITIDNIAGYRDAMISIYNMQGQLLLQMPLQQKTEINISKFVKGVYALKIENKDHLIIEKFIKY